MFAFGLFDFENSLKIRRRGIRFDFFRQDNLLFDWILCFWEGVDVGLFMVEDIVFGAESRLLNLYFFSKFSSYSFGRLKFHNEISYCSSESSTKFMLIASINQEQSKQKGEYSYPNICRRLCILFFFLYSFCCFRSNYNYYCRCYLQHSI